MENPPTILQICPNQTSGGANILAHSLHRAYLSRGYRSYMAVGQKDYEDEFTFPIPNQDHATPWIRFWGWVENRLISNRHGNLAKIAAWLAHINRSIQMEFGIENYDYPGTYDLLQLPPEPPDIVHAHNLHVNYFDLRALPWLSRQRPLILSLHDAWLLSGNCAHSFDCERWMTGCGHCPNLRIYPPKKRDATAYNWRLKQQVYESSRFYLTTASQWLMEKVNRSMISSSILDARLIPYGVDLGVFKPRQKRDAQAVLGIPPQRPVVLLRAKSLNRKNFWTDYPVAEAVIAALQAQGSQIPVTILVLGANKPDQQFGRSEIRYIPHRKENRDVALYYQAADVYLHIARADTFPLAILEALACGTPVVASQVGGIPEQIVHGVTGYLVPLGDSKTMLDHVNRLLVDTELRARMSRLAVDDARKRFDHERFVSDNLDWYWEILDSRLQPQTGR